MRVVLCEDDVDARNCFKEYLENEGIEVVPVDSGNGALALLTHHYFDAVFTDYTMADGDGKMLSKFCEDRGVPCVIFTGRDPSEVRPHISYKIPIYNKVDFMDIAARNLLRDVAKSPQLDKAFYKVSK